jgi:hypothetical protein
MKQLAKFARWAIENSAFEGCDLDGHDVQMKATELGILSETKFDPKKHGSSAIAEPGDRWYVFTDKFKAALGKAK